MEDFSRYTRSYLSEHPGEKEAITQEHLQRIAQGKQVWNAWAERFSQYIKKFSLSDAIIDFSSTNIGSNLNFSHLNFPCVTNFEKAKFLGNAYFREAMFLDHAYFLTVIFSGDAYFHRAVFSKKALFTSSVFEQVNYFYKSSFKTDVPDFNFAAFKQAPHLANVSIPFLEKQQGLVERYRKLKQMAQSSKDREKELQFFGYEVHAKAYQTETHWTHKIFIKFYYWFSNFGTSFLRPILSILIFWVLMFFANQLFIQADSVRCQSTPSEYQHQLASYTLSQSLPLVRLEKSQQIAMDTCLFGETPVKTLKHSLWRIVHLVPTTFFLFLFGLAVRNRFKIA